jgi:mitotic spindle assembly checkpoint protein MAD2
LQSWLIERKIRKLVVVLTSVETKEVLERWEFKVEYEEGADQAEGSKENVDTNVAASQQGFRNVINKVGSHYSGFFSGLNYCLYRTP